MHLIEDKEDLKKITAFASLVPEKSENAKLILEDPELLDN